MLDWFGSLEDPVARGTGVVFVALGTTLVEVILKAV
jgi:hypothetical protein